jgi:uncharacterized protein (TIGR04141 family)
MKFVAAEKTGVSIYRLRTGRRLEVESTFKNRTSLSNGLDGWFYLFPPSENTPQWVRALEPHLPPLLVKGVQSASHAGLVLISRQGIDYLLAFGFAWMHLDDLWLEPDFGRCVVLNTVLPGKLLELNSEQVFARRHVARERAPKPGSLSTFGVDFDRDLVAAVEGVPSEPLFGGIVRGATSLRLKIEFTTINSVLDKTAPLFSSKAYKKRYPDIDNLTPVYDPALITQLDDLLGKDLASGIAEKSIAMCAPAFRRGEREYASDFVMGRMSSNPATSPYLEYSAWKFYLQKHGDSPNIALARQTKLHMLNDDGTAFDGCSVYDCFGYEVSLGGETFIFSSGQWYRAETKFTNGVDKTIDALTPTKHALPAAIAGEKEGPYNLRCGQVPGMLVMDKKLVHYGGNQSKFEFCDFMHIKKRTLFCAKIPTASSDCSHLTEQSRRTLELFFSADPGFRQNTKKVMLKKHAGVDTSWLDSKPKPGDWSMCLVLMHKAVDKLPLFARCTIARHAKYCDERGHNFYVQSV